MSAQKELNATIVDLQSEVSQLRLQNKQQDNIAKKEIAILEQRIELQEMQITEAKAREDNLKKMNETFMESLSALSSENNKFTNKSLKDLKGMLEGINSDNEASKLKRIDLITKLEKENRELKDQIHEKILELGRVTSDYEKHVANEELLQKELTSLKEDIKKREKEAKAGRENAEKDLATRIAEMSALEDKLRRECQNEIERNNNQNEERFLRIKELYQKELSSHKKLREEESEWDDRKSESFVEDLSISQTNVFPSDPFHNLHMKDKSQMEIIQEKKAREELERRLQEMQEKFKEFQEKNKNCEQSIQLMKDKFERQKIELQELEKLRQKLKSMKEKSKTLKEKIAKAEKELEKLREQVIFKDLQLEEERQAQNKIIKAFKDQQLSFIHHDTSNFMTDNDISLSQINQKIQQQQQQLVMSSSSPRILSQQSQIISSQNPVSQQQQPLRDTNSMNHFKSVSESTDCGVSVVQQGPRSHSSQIRKDETSILSAREQPKRSSSRQHQQQNLNNSSVQNVSSMSNQSGQSQVGQIIQRASNKTPDSPSSSKQSSNNNQISKPSNNVLPLSLQQQQRTQNNNNNQSINNVNNLFSNGQSNNKIGQHSNQEQFLQSQQQQQQQQLFQQPQVSEQRIQQGQQPGVLWNRSQNGLTSQSCNFFPGRLFPSQPNSSRSASEVTPNSQAAINTSSGEHYNNSNTPNSNGTYNNNNMNPVDMYSASNQPPPSQQQEDHSSIKDQFLIPVFRSDGEFGTFAAGMNNNNNNLSNNFNEISSCSHQQSIVSASGILQSVVSRNICEGCRHQAVRCSSHPENIQVGKSIFDQREVEGLRIEISELQRILQEYEREIVFLQNERNSMQSVNSSLQSQNSSMQIQISNLQTSSSNLQSQNIRLQSSNSSLQSELSAVQTTNSNLSTLNSTLQRQVVDLERKIEARSKEQEIMKDSLENKEKEISEAAELRSQAEEEKMKKTENEMLLKQEIKYLVEKLLIAKEKIEALESKVNVGTQQGQIEQKQQMASQQQIQQGSSNSAAVANNSQVKTNISIIKQQLIEKQQLQKQQQQQQQHQLQQAQQQNDSSTQFFSEKTQYTQQQYSSCQPSQLFQKQKQLQSHSIIPESAQMQISPRLNLSHATQLYGKDKNSTSSNSFSSHLGGIKNYFTDNNNNHTSNTKPNSNEGMINTRINKNNNSSHLGSASNDNNFNLDSNNNNNNNNSSNLMNNLIEDNNNDTSMRLPTADSTIPRKRENGYSLVDNPQRFSNNNKSFVSSSIVHQTSFTQARESVSSSLCLNGSTKSPGFLNFINQNKENSSFQTRKHPTEADQRSPSANRTLQLPLSKTRISQHNISNCSSSEMPNQDQYENNRNNSFNISSNSLMSQAQQVRQSNSLIRSSQQQLQQQQKQQVSSTRSDRKVQEKQQQFQYEKSAVMKNLAERDYEETEKAQLFGGRAKIPFTSRFSSLETQAQQQSAQIDSIDLTKRQLFQARRADIPKSVSAKPAGVFLLD